MALLLITAETVAAAVKMPFSSVVVALFLSYYLHAACAWGEGSRMLCPLTNVVDEHTRVVTVTVTGVDPQPVAATRLSVHALTTSVTLTSTTFLLSDHPMNAYKVEVSI